MTRWLLENNQEFYNYYHGSFSPSNTTVSNRIEARIDRVKSRIEDLIDLRLIHQNGTAKATKGNATIPLYEYTELGHFVALFIRGMKPDRNKARSDKQMYDLFNTELHKFPSSVEAFCSIFYKKCQDTELFGQVASVCKNILESELRIQSIQDLFEYLIILPFNKNISSATTKELWNLWKE